MPELREHERLQLKAGTRKTSRLAARLDPSLERLHSSVRQQSVDPWPEQMEWIGSEAAPSAAVADASAERAGEQAHTSEDPRRRSTERSGRRVTRERAAERETQQTRGSASATEMGEAHLALGSAAFGNLLIERRRRRDALDAHIASLSSIQRAGMLAMVRHGLGLKDRDWQARYDELAAALDDVERAVHEALGVMDIAPTHSEHAVRVGG